MIVYYVCIADRQAYFPTPSVLYTGLGPCRRTQGRPQKTIAKTNPKIAHGPQTSATLPACSQPHWATELRPGYSTALDLRHRKGFRQSLVSQ